MPAFSQIYVAMSKSFPCRMYSSSVAPIGHRPFPQLRPVALKGGIIARRPESPILGTGWNHLEPAEPLVLLKHRILGHVTEWRLRPVSTNEGGRKKKKKKIEGRSAIRPCHFFFLWSPHSRVPNRSILSLAAEPIRTSVTRSLLHLSREAPQRAG